MLMLFLKTTAQVSLRRFLTRNPLDQILSAVFFAEKLTTKLLGAHRRKCAACRNQNLIHVDLKTSVSFHAIFLAAVAVSLALCSVSSLDICLTWAIRQTAC